MITIKRAHRQDLASIQALMATYSLFTISVECLNKRDIALKAIDTETGALIGFAWGGLMAQNTLIYIDKVTVHPAYAKKGVAQELYHRLFNTALKLGAKKGFGIIRQDQYHDKAAMNALKMAFAADAQPYTYVYGDAEKITKELSMLEAS